MKLSPSQQQIALDESRFKVVVAGRRFGKTYLAMRQLAYYGRIPNREIFYITSSYRAAKMILWKPLKHRMMDLRWAEKINESELSILLKNGTTISLKGSENKDSLRGISLDYCVIDEVAECDPDLFPEIIRPALADRQGHAMFIGTPKGKGNYFYDLYTQGQSLANWRSWQFTTLQGGNVTADEIEAARADMSERQFRQEFLATFETYQNRVAWAFEREHNLGTLETPDTAIIHVGVDFNRNPITATIGVIKDNRMFVIDEIVIYSSNTNELGDEIRNRYPRSKVFVYPDPSGSRQQTSSRGNSDHAILGNEPYNFIVKSPRKHDPVKDRINAINARFCSADGIRHLFIHPKAKYTIESLEKYTYKEGTQIPDKDSGFDHIFDALSYCVAFLWPITKTVTTDVQPQRWGHQIQ